VQKLRFLKLENVSIFEQLQLEEKLLRGSTENFCLYNVGSPPAVVMGISGKKEELVHLPNPLPLIRRFSGGGTVVINEETHFLTWIFNHADTPTKPFPKSILHYVGEQVEELLPGSTISENDFTLNELKFGGNAQYITKKRWLHHTSLLWDYNPKQMAYLKHPRKTPAYREGRSHEAFLHKLKDSLSEPEEILERLEEALEKRYNVIPTSLEEVENTSPTRRSTLILEPEQ